MLTKEATMQDHDLNKLKDVIFKGWPAYRKQCPQELWDYWTFICDLVIEDGLILKGESSYQKHLEVKYLMLYIQDIKVKPNAYFLQESQYSGLVLQMTLSSW